MSSLKVKPYFGSVKLQGMFLSIEVTKKPNVSIDDYLKGIKKQFGDLIVFVKCPKCGREVPKIDMTIYNQCYVCFLENEAQPSMEREAKPK